MTGDLLGTLRYMSPEQALARRVVDRPPHRHLLAGRDALRAADAPAGLRRPGPAEVLRQIAEEEPTPLRRLNPAVPRDLETIVLKAMAKEPAARYATAQELADDLRRFLESKPIPARRPRLAGAGGEVGSAARRRL